MGNQFLGFPVPRARIADMIATAAPPLSHHIQHENGGSDEIDATGLTGASGGGGIATSLILSSQFESLDGYAISVIGTGSYILNAEGVTLDTGVVLGGSQAIQKNIYDSYTNYSYTNDQSIIVDVAINFSGSATGIITIIRGFPGTLKHFGFVLVNGILKGTVGNGTTETLVTLETIDTIAFYAIRSLKAVFTHGVKCEFYSDKILLGTITTGLPTGLDTNGILFYAEIKNTTVNENKEVIISSWNIQIQQ